MISVIIPTYNRRLFIKRAIQSVLNQETPCEELLIVDDGSTDGTDRVIESIEEASSVQIRYFHQENKGAAAARNYGIKEAKGKWLAFLDSDDWWDRKKLTLQLKAMEEHTQYSVSHTREKWFRNGRQVNQKKKHDPPHGEIFSRSLGMCVVGMSTVMAEKRLFERYGLFDESLPCCEDYDLWVRVSRQEQFLLIPERLTSKEGGREDQLSNIHRMGMDVFRIKALVKLLTTDDLSPGQRQEVVQELQRKCLIYGNGCLKHGHRHQGEIYLQIAKKYTNEINSE